MSDQGPTKATVSHEREVVTYSWLWHASRVTLEIGQNGVHGAAWQRLASTLLAAFAVEAFLNHVGTSLLSNWPEIERKHSVLAKIRLIAKELGVDLGSKDERPLSTVRELVSFRNALAHGRTVQLKPPDQLLDLTEDIDKHLVDGAPLTDWEEKIRSDDFAMRAQADVEELLLTIHRAMAEPKDRLFHTGTHMSAATAVR